MYVRTLNKRMFIFTLLLVLCLILYDWKFFNQNFHSRNNREIYSHLEIPIIRKCNLSCNRYWKSNNTKFQIQRNKNSRMSNSNHSSFCHIRKYSNNELIINGKKLKLLGIVFLSKKRYAIISSDKGISLLKIGDRICDVLKVVDINEQSVIIKDNANTYTLNVFSGYLRD